MCVFFGGWFYFCLSVCLFVVLFCAVLFCALFYIQVIFVIVYTLNVR